MATFVELTTMQDHPILVNLDQVLRILADVDLAGATLLHFCDGSRQIVREPLREVLGLLNLREAEFHLSKVPA